ncbi:MAG: TlpA family protein disulfide reductase [Chloroflexi bacterium]|nr:TlpA family protein disulfide reductase [Chloroflexota bacterium]
MNDLIETDLTPETEEPKQSRQGKVMLGVIALVGLGLLAIFYYGVLNPPNKRVSEGMAPPIEMKTYDGEPISLAAYRGKPVIVNFWASWCLSCREEQPILEAAWRKYKDRVMFIGIAYLDQEVNARAYMEEFDVTYPYGPDLGSRIYTAYHVQGVPETFFIDAEGKLHGFHVGPISAQALDERIQQLLAAVP